MFKPLLRTLPSLNGNIKIGCSLSDYHKLSNINNEDWECYVRHARLLPLSSNLSQRNIECNLLYSTYDYDLPKFFRYYSSIFFDDCFDFDKNNLIELDKTKAQKNRNTDFEFGCKRVSYLKNDAQFAFYAPIYIESIDDIPDYFKINITLRNDKYVIKRTLKVNISKEDKRNYLNIYLKRYLENLDSNVIFCNTNANQATYYGIDLIKGGFIKKVDHIIAKIWSKQNTINNFDAIVTNGFKRNQIAMRQIIPFCWYFNVNSMLSEEEKEKFKNCSLYINGLWYKNGNECAFYNIDTNYQTFFDYPYMLNTTNGIFSYKNTGNNIMNMEYPSLNESMYRGYRYSNKLSLKYNRWKLKYSDDEHPYVTNLSPAFSINQSSMYKYGAFPEKYVSLNVITDTDNNIIIPIGNALKSPDSPYYNDYKLVTNYLNIINNNASTWYELVNNINDIYNQDIWGDVKDDKVYYKGILYDFSKIYQTYPNLTKKIDKFSVIVNLHYNILSKEEINNIKKADISLFNSTKYITDVTAWLSERIPDGFSSGEFAKLPTFYNAEDSFGRGNAQLVFDQLYTKAEGGDFIDLLSLGYNPYDINKYYKYSDIIYNFNEENGYYDNIVSKLTKNESFDEYFKDGYEMLPIYKLNNILHQNKQDIMFEGEDSQEWILNNLYFSQHGNYYKSRYDRDTIKILIEEYGDDSKMIPLYLKGKFISKANLINMLYYIYGESWNIYESILDNLVIYEYHPRIKDDSSATYACDVYIQKDFNVGDNYGNNIPLDKKDEDVLYLDTYNMNNVISNYNSRFGTNYSLSEDTYEMYAKFLNMKHLLFYISDLYKNANSIEDIEQLAKSLYIRKRIILGNENTENLVFKDLYIPVLNLYDKFRLLSKEEKIAILKSGLSLNIIQKEIAGGNGEKEDVIEDNENMYQDLLGIGIYKKVNDNIYRNDSYKLEAYGEPKLMYWVCEPYHCQHPVHYDADGNLDLSVCSGYHQVTWGHSTPYIDVWHPDSNEPPTSDELIGERYFGYEINEYHQDDFYYRPDFYVKYIDSTSEKFVSFLDYIQDPSLYTGVTYSYERVYLKDALSTWEDNDGTKFYYATIKNVDNITEDIRYDSVVKASDKEYHEFNFNMNQGVFNYGNLENNYLYIDEDLIDINRRDYVKQEEYSFFTGETLTENLYRAVTENDVTSYIKVNSIYEINSSDSFFKKNDNDEYKAYNLVDILSSSNLYIKDYYNEFNMNSLKVRMYGNDYSIYDILNELPTLYTKEGEEYREYPFDINNLAIIPDELYYQDDIDVYKPYTAFNEFKNQIADLYFKGSNGYSPANIDLEYIYKKGQIPVIYTKIGSNYVVYSFTLDDLKDLENLPDLYITNGSAYESYDISSSDLDPELYLTLYTYAGWKQVNSNDIGRFDAFYKKEINNYIFEDETNLREFPQLYKRNETTYSLISNTELLNYLNYDSIKLLLTEELNEKTLEMFNLGNGRHSSNQPLGFDNINLNDKEVLSQMQEIQDVLKSKFSNIKNYIYVRSYLDRDSYTKYTKEFTGINDFDILDDIKLKIAIINEEINLLTYTIDEHGEFVEHPYDEDKYYVLRNQNDPDWKDYLKNTISEFVSELNYHEADNYYTMSDAYNQKHDLDNIMNINDINGQTKSDFTFEVVYKKKFTKINKDIFNMMNLDNDKHPYKDLYIYRLYKADEYPAALRMFYTTELSKLIDYNSIHYSLYPLFDDILLQDKKYSVIYSEYNQSNIYEANVGNDKNYRYNLSDIIYMYDISDVDEKKEYEITYNGEHKYAYTYAYMNKLKELKSEIFNNRNEFNQYDVDSYNEITNSIANHIVLPTYSLVNNCYSNITYVNDSIDIYNKFNINTYSYKEYETYTYSYNSNELVKIYKNGSYFTELAEVEREATGIREKDTTYGFILIDAYIDNTNSSFNIVDTKYKRKKYYTSVNGHYIYDNNFSILDSFNLLLPFSKMNLIDNLLKFDNVIIHPTKCMFDTFYKQSEINDEFGYTYAYNINMNEARIDTLTLQRYFDSIVPYIPESTVLNSSYCLKYKNYNYSTQDINYMNDVFYAEDINMYNYNKLKVYDSFGSYTMYTPIEYKHLNDNKLLNLPEYFKIPMKGKFEYNKLLELESEESTIEKFKNYVLSSKLNQFDDNEILFLYNKYKVEYDTTCIGLNAVKTQKLYTLTYKFTLL